MSGEDQWVSREAMSVPDLAVLQATDAMLDRLGRRDPTLDDLDDPVLAALAVFAADVDMDPVPVLVTRRAVQAAGLLPPTAPDPVPGRPSRPPAVEPPAFDRGFRTGQVLPAAPALLPAVAHGFVGPGFPPVPVLPSTEPQPLAPGARGPATPRVASFRVRVVPVLAAAAGAVVLSMGAAAAVSGGETVDPRRVVDTLIQQVTGNRTPTPSPAVPGSGARSSSRPAAGTARSATTVPAGPGATGRARPPGSPDGAPVVGPDGAPATGDPATAPQTEAAVPPAATLPGDPATQPGGDPTGPATSTSGATSAPGTGTAATSAARSSTATAGSASGSSSHPGKALGQSKKASPTP